MNREALLHAQALRSASSATGLTPAQIIAWERARAYMRLASHARSVSVLAGGAQPAH